MFYHDGFSRLILTRLYFSLWNFIPNLGGLAMGNILDNMSSTNLDRLIQTLIAPARLLTKAEKRLVEYLMYSGGASPHNPADEIR